MNTASSRPVSPNNDSSRGKKKQKIDINKKNNSRSGPSPSPNATNAGAKRRRTTVALPPEIMEKIAEKINKIQNVAALASSSRGLRSVAGPIRRERAKAMGSNDALYDAVLAHLLTFLRNYTGNPEDPHTFWARLGVRPRGGGVFFKETPGCGAWNPPLWVPDYDRRRNSNNNNNGYDPDYTCYCATTGNFSVNGERMLIYLFVNRSEGWAKIAVEARAGRRGIMDVHLKYPSGALDRIFIHTPGRLSANGYYGRFGPVPPQLRTVWLNNPLLRTDIRWAIQDKNSYDHRNNFYAENGSAWWWVHYPIPPQFESNVKESNQSRREKQASGYWKRLRAAMDTIVRQYVGFKVMQGLTAPEVNSYWKSLVDQPHRRRQPPKWKPKAPWTKIVGGLGPRQGGIRVELRGSSTRQRKTVHGEVSDAEGAVISFDFRIDDSGSLVTVRGGSAEDRAAASDPFAVAGWKVEFKPSPAANKNKK